MENRKKFSKGFMLYKAQNNGNGSASQWNLGSEKDCVFLEMSNQTGKDDKGNARFDWDNKIRFKLGDADIGEIISVLVGVKDGVGPFDKDKEKYKGLFHSNPNGNSILYLGKDRNGILRICLSVKKDGNQIRVQHAITIGEACILNTLLRRAIEVMYGWD